MNLAWELFPWKDSFLLDAPASRPRFFFFRPYVTGFVGFFMLGATALYLAFSNWSQPAIGAVMLQNDGFPVLVLAHVSPAAVDVLCVIDISQMVARVNIQGLLIPVANEQCDFDALRRRGIKSREGREAEVRELSFAEYHQFGLVSELKYCSKIFKTFFCMALKIWVS